MREIKFRAWNEEDKEMFDVRAIFLKGCYWYRFHHFEETVGCEIGPGDCGEREIQGKSPILMQYTGLKDKNGKEIYEGDVVKSTQSKTKGDVCWRKNASFGVRTKGCRFAVDMDEWEWEVIGNIYENPELLEALNG